MRKFMTTLVALVFAGGISYGANVPLLSGAQYSEPSQILNTLNVLIQSLNSNIGGLANSQTAPFTGIATTVEQTMYTYTLPASAIANAGQSRRVSCWGGTAASGGTKTMKLYFGAQVVATPAAATSNKGWYLDEIVTTRSAAVQSYLGRGLVDTTAVSPVTTSATETLASGVTIKCTGTQGNASAGDILASGFVVELIK